MIAFEFAAVLGEGATLVTPNNRLARHLVNRYDDAQRDLGRRAWVAGRCLPWQGWLKSLWLDVVAADAMAEPRQLISDAGATHLWERVVAQESSALLDTQGAATQAAEAWKVFHAWRRPDDRFQGWSRAGIGDDAAAFARWAQNFSAVLEERGLADSAQLADVLADAAPRIAVWRGQRVVAVGFIEFTPQQRRLLSALRAAGVAVTEEGIPAVPASTRRRVTCATPQSELDGALAWARERALADPSATIGIVVDDLSSRRDEVAARADDILCPALAPRVLPDAARPYAISFGARLSDVPVVASALSLIMLGAGSLPLADAAGLLRSAHLPGAERHWMRRASTERLWREQGLRTVNFGAFVHALDAFDADLAAQWRAMPVQVRATRSPAQWSDDWRTWLGRVGWPGDRPLHSSEWQACEAWSQLLADFRLHAAVTPALNRDDALRTLRSMTTRTIFQPESPSARVQILGVLEASGLVFDALWITGMSADRWPPAPQPNPLLPHGWQRERHVPRSEPAVDLAHARALTAGFAGAAREVVVSHASIVDGFACAGSALFAHWETCDRARLPTPTGYAMAIATRANRLLPCQDDHAPPMPVGARARGGTGIIESQSTCPFQAFARYRLIADAWPETSEGLTARERGILLHATLAALWDDLGDQATLLGLARETLDAKVSAAVARGRAKLDRARWQSLPPSVASGETQRLADTVRAWLLAVETGRPPFTVQNTELPLDLAVGGLGIRVRIDRVDTLADGGVAVIDYKSGRAIPPAQWFAPRPSGTQVGLYALALAERPEAPQVRALVYAQLKAGEIGVQGVTDDAATWPPLKALSQLPLLPAAQWSDLPRVWADGLGALAAEFRDGIAAVAPRDGKACRCCNLQALCRVQSLDVPPDTAGSDDD